MAVVARALDGRREPERLDNELSATVSGVDMRLLKYFVVLAEELNFRRAAHRLFIAQPPLTRAIQSLEQRLGVQLVARQPTGVALTHAGEVLLRHSRDLLAAHHALLARMESLKTESEMRVDIGFSGAAAGLSPFALARRLRHTKSALIVRTVDLGIGADCNALVQGRLDVAVLASPVDFPPGLAHAVLRRTTIVTAVPAAHSDPRVAEQELPVVRIRNVPESWPQQGNDATSAAGVVVDSYDEALNRVAAGENSLLTLDTCAQRYARPDVSHIEHRDAPGGCVFLAWRIGPHSQLTDLCCRLAQDLVSHGGIN